jgi:hypothetical protein
VLLTGGSSKLPIIADLADGESVIRGVRFKFEKIDELPQWIDALPRDRAEMTAQEFSQCAVAIGGCAPQLPNERKDLFAPVTSHVQQGKWVLNRYQARGIQARRSPIHTKVHRRREPAGALGLLSRLTADLNSSYSPTVARHDATRNQATIASFRIVAAEAGGVAATAAETAHAAASRHHG